MSKQVPSTCTTVYSSNKHGTGQITVHWIDPATSRERQRTVQYDHAALDAHTMAVATVFRRSILSTARAYRIRTMRDTGWNYDLTTTEPSSH